MLKDAIDLNGIKRVLITKLRHHGDVLLTSPVFTVLKNHAPHLALDALVYQDTAEMLSLHPGIDEIHVIDRQWKKTGVFTQAQAEWKLLTALKARNYDLIIHLTKHPRGAWLRILNGTRYAVAPKPLQTNWLWQRGFSHLYALPRNTQRHTVELNLDALRRIGVYPEENERKLSLVPGNDAEAAIAQILADAGLLNQRFIHLHPASRWLFKCWESKKTALLINLLVAQNLPVVLTAAPDPREMALIQNILRDVTVPVTDLSGRLNLKELAALTARAACFVGVDSAPMHIAAAMQTPVVALFGPSGEIEWGPWQVPHHVINSSHPCRPCGNDGCGGGKVSECLTTLPVTRVLGAVQDLLLAT